MKYSSSAGQSVIICVDDDPELLETLEFLLAKNFQHHRIIACVNGQDAIEQLQECRATGQEVQLIVTDQVMDDISGTDVLSRAPDLYPDAVRIILTGQAGLQSAIDAVKLGVDDYLEKPISEGELVKTIRNHLHSYLLTQDNKRLQEFVKQTYLRTSEITDLAFRSFNYHLNRLLSHEGDRREVLDAIKKARENINLLSHLYKINQAMATGDSFTSIAPTLLVNDALTYVKGRNGPGLLIEKEQHVDIRSYETDNEIYGNPAVLRIVIERILENACKFSPAQSTITIAIRGSTFAHSPEHRSSALQPDLIQLLKDGFTIVSITDEGTPTREDFQNLLYVQEWQQPSQQNIPTLKGLGLVIAQEHLLILGGHLFIESKVGDKGTTVHIAFPNDARGSAPRQLVMSQDGRN